MTMPSPWITLPAWPEVPAGHAKAPTWNLLFAAAMIGELPAEVWSATASLFCAKSDRSPLVFEKITSPFEYRLWKESHVDFAAGHWKSACVVEPGAYRLPPL